jgi:riboflavin synthase
MFTGIIEEIGETMAVETAVEGAGSRLRVRAGNLLEGARIGESIAVSGVCLTIVAVRPSGEDRIDFDVELAAETLRRTTLGRLRPGDFANLERPLRFDDRLGGHLVQGHVDGVGLITEIRPEGQGIWMEIEAPAALLAYLAEKGSVAVDGISLTVAGLGTARRFAVALIPHTLARTTLGRRKLGDTVNLEVDILAKYLGRFLEGVRGHEGSDGDRDG